MTSGFLGHFVRTVYSHGGDVTAFAGDALVCAFKAESGEDMPGTTERAVRCALALKDLGTLQLTAHVGLVAGLLSLGVLGGGGGLWTCLITGEPLMQLSACVDEASAKQLVVSATTYECLLRAVAEDRVTATRTATGNFNISAMGAAQKKRSGSASANPNRNRIQQFPQTPEFLAYGRQFMPPPALSSISNGLTRSLATLTQVTTLFLKLDSFSHAVYADAVSLQPFFLIAQERIAARGGFMRQFLVDDKGCVVIAMWGVTTSMHTNCCDRAVLCAKELWTSLRAADLQCSIGVSVGQVFSGTVGSQQRRDFVGMGTKVNFAARLMGKAKGGVLVDEDVYSEATEALRSKLHRHKDGLKLKGYDELAFPYWLGLANDAGRRMTLGGNASEEVDIDQSLCVDIEELLGGESARMLVLNGSRGMGKRAVAAYFVEEAQKSDFRCFAIDGDGARRGGSAQSPAIRRLFFVLAKERRLTSNTDYVRFAGEAVAGAHPDIDSTTRMACIARVMDILGISAADSEVSSFLGDLQQQGEGLSITERSVACEGLVDASFQLVLAKLLARYRTALVFFNLHLCDELSLREAERLLSSDVNCCVLATMDVKKSANSSSSRGSANSLLGHANCRIHEILPLTRGQMREYLEEKLKSISDPESLVDLIAGISNGVLYWVRFLADFLNSKSPDLLLKEMGKDGGIALLRVPFMMRLETLSPEQQIVLRYSCLLGSTISKAILSAVLPHVDVSEVLLQLSALNFIQSIDADNLSFEFSNQVISNYLCELIPPSEVSQMHAKVGSHLLELESELKVHGYKRYSTKHLFLLVFIQCLCFCRILHHFRCSREKVHEVPHLTIKYIAMCFERGNYNEAFRHSNKLCEMPSTVVTRGLLKQFRQLLESEHDKVDPVRIRWGLLRVLHLRKPSPRAVVLEELLKRISNLQDGRAEEDHDIFQRAVSNHVTQSCMVLDEELQSHQIHQTPQARCFHW